MSSLPPDPYKTLGVSKDAQLSEIRSAHRKLILKCHPDKVQDPTLKAQKQDEFQKVQQAYELLSDENERAKYDDNVKLAELRKEMAKGMSANTSAPRAPRTYEVRTAEPRPDTFTKTTYRPSPGTKMYSQYNSRSWDEEIHSRSNSIFEEPRARRATSYEKPSRDRQDDDIRDRERERRRREDRDREREELARAADRREREREKERQADKKVAERAAKRAAEEKEARRQERKRQEKADKEREKERRRDAEEKSRRHKQPVYMESFDDEPTYIAKSDKKKSSSSSTTKEKKEDKRSRSIPRDGVPLRDDLPVPPVPLPPPDHKTKMTGAMLFAATYMDQSRKTGAVNPHPGLNRSQTHDVRYAPPVPTPPAAAPYVVPPPPIPAEEDSSRRSKSRRSSETKTREKSSHKKSSPTKEPPMAVPPSPNVVDASPSSRQMPQFVSSASSPISTSPPKAPLRSATFNDGSFSRPPPGIIRAQTFSHVPADPELRSSGRGRSRMQPQILSEDSESDDDRRPHRSHRHRTHSPEPVPADYGQRTRYSVSGGRTVPILAESVYPPMYHEESSPSSRKHSKTAYYERPSMPSREASYTNSAYFSKVKTARYEPVQYSDLPHGYRDEYNVGYA